ncbi:phage tail tape measure protein [Heyndrickxia oleronia]|uniref:phage tail tape measure protein n=1 Tax=Heyndrickxia oleronia TaxID=38875 RepID=UPI00203F77BB|nr:phage tail tape measure protein [Heyndrickxia oleronia]MCM3454453.1 phage tail tape measure protein [Heyndrickxia oleronia]
MAKGTDVKVRLYSNSKEFNSEMSAVARQMKLVKSEFEANRTSINVWGNELKQSEAKVQLLTQQIELQRKRVQTLKDAYLDSAAQKGKDAKETENLAKRLNYATAELNKMQNELTATNKKMNQFGENQNIKKFQTDMSALSLRMKQIDADFSLAASSSKNFDNALNKTQLHADALTKKIDVQKQAISRLEEEYRRISQSKGKDAQETKNLELEITKANTKLNNFQNELTQTNTKLGTLEKELKNQNSGFSKFSSNLDSVGSKMRNVGASVGITASIGFSAISLSMKQAVGVAMDFGRGMSEVKAISGATTSEFKLLEQQAKDLGAATIFSASQAAEGMKYLALAGWKTNEIISAMPGMLDLAAAGNLDLGRAADITSDTMQAFGLSAEKASHASDVFAYAQANANTNVEQMGEAMKYLAPAAHSLGWTLEESAAATMSLANAGIKGSLAGQAFGTSLTRLAKEPTKKIKNAMDDLNFSFFDTEGHMKSLPVIIKGLENSMEGWTDKQKAATLITIFGAEAYKHWAVLLDAGSQTLEENTQALERADGAAKRMADTMTDNAYGKVVELQSAFEGLQITLSQHLMSAFEGVVVKLTNIIRWFQNLDKGTQETIVKTTALGTAMLGVVGVVGTLTMGIGALMTFAGPVGLAITGITAGLGALGLALFAAHEHTENLRKKQEEAEISAIRYGEGLSKGTMKGVKGYTDLYEGAKLKMLELQNMSGEKAKATSQEVVNAFSKMADQVIAALETQKQKLTNAINEVYEIAGKAGKDKAKEMTNTVLESFDKDIADYKKALDTVKEAHEKYNNDISKMPAEFATKYQEALKIMEGGAKEFARTQDELRAIQKSISDKQGKVLADEAEKYTKSINDSYKKSIDAANKYYGDKQKTFEQALSQGRISQEQYNNLMTGVESRTNQMLALAAQERDKALSTLTSHLDTRGKLIDIATGKEFEKQKKYMSTATGYVYSVEETTSEYFERWKAHTEEVLKSSTNFSKKTKSEYEKDLAAFLKSTGMTKEQAVKTAKQMVDESLNEMSKGDDKAKKAGENKGNAHNEGLDSTTSRNMRTAKEITDEVKNVLSKTSDGGGGKKAGEELSNGILSKYTTVFNSAAGLANRGKEGLKSVKTEDAGQGFVSGFINSISVASTGNSIFNAAWNLGKTALSALKQSIDSHSPSKQTEKEGKNYADGFKEGIKKNTKSASASAKAMATAVQKAFNSAMDDAQYKFKMGKIDANGYIKELQKVSKQYAKTGDQIKKVNLEIEKARKDALKKEAEALKKSFDQSKAYIDKKKQTNELALAEELAAWERVQARFKKGSKEREEAEQNVFRVKKEIHDKLTSLNDEYLTKVQEINQKLIDEENALNEEYRKAVEDRTNELYSFAGIFDEVSLKADVTGEKLVQNLVDQVNLFSQWATSIEELAQKGIDKGLLEELRQMGPKAAAEVIALNNMTDTQLEDFVRLWKVKNELARQQATNELEGIKTDTKKKIDELHKNANSQLEQLKTDWAKKIKEIRNGTTNEFNAMNASMSAIGKNTIQGLMNGMRSMEGPLMAQARSIADSISSTIRKSLQVRSPSRLTYQIGEFVGQGLGGGMLDQVDSVMAAAKQLAKSAIPNVSGLANIIGSAANGIRSNSHEFIVRNQIESPGLEDKLDKLLTLLEKAFLSGVAGGNFTQQLIFNSPNPKPSETARKSKQALQHLAPEWGLTT